MKIPQLHRMSTASQLSLLAVVILMGAVFVTVNSALQQHNQSSKASGATNILLNPSFESGTTNWHLSVTSPAAGNFTTTTSSPEDGASAAQVNITTADPSNNWHVQLQQLYLPMQAGQTYTVTFWAKASSSRSISSVVQSNTSPYPVYAQTFSNITTSWTQYSYSFVAPVSNSDVFVGFNLASATGTVWIDNVSYSIGSGPAPTAGPISQAPGATQPITSDSHSAAQIHYANSSISWSHTVGNNANRLLIVGVAVHGGITVSTPPTFGSQTFTRLSNKIYKSGSEDDEFWYLKNPNPGTATITVNFTGTAYSVAGSASFYNVDQSQTFGPVATGTCDCTSGSISVPSSSNQLVVDSMASDTTYGDFHPASGQTLYWNGYPQVPQNGFSSKPSTGSTTTMTWTDSQTDNWADIGVALLPASTVVQPQATQVPPQATQVPPQATQVPPQAPTGLTATAGNGQVTLSWNAIGNDSYNIYVQDVTANTSATKLPNPVSTNTFIVTPLINGHAYVFTVSAVANGVEGAISRVSIFLPPIATTMPSPTSLPQPIATSTPVTLAPGSTGLYLTIGLQGIGTAGDSADPNSDGNMNPHRPTRTVEVFIYDAQNQLVADQLGNINYNSSTGKFNGTINLGNTFATGLYTIKVKTDQYLRTLIPGIQTITQGQTQSLPNVILPAGDINGDNSINIVDYNIIIGCYSDLLPPSDPTCTAGSANNVLSDLNDDGQVNQFDYNLFLRELTNIGGQ